MVDKPSVSLTTLVNEQVKKVGKHDLFVLLFTPEEIANMDISKMNYIQFLEITSNIKISVSNLTVDIVSEDGLIRVIKEANRGNLTIRQAPREIADISSRFECYKSLSVNQKLKLLNQVIRRLH